jgi:hypothetical protein
VQDQTTNKGHQTLLDAPSQASMHVSQILGVLYHTLHLPSLNEDPMFKSCFLIREIPFQRPGLYQSFAKRFTRLNYKDHIFLDKTKGNLNLGNLTYCLDKEKKTTEYHTTAIFDCSNQCS